MYLTKQSHNSKISGNYKVAATYLPIKQTCPKTCPLRDNGCYAQLGRPAIHNSRLEKLSKGKSSLSIVRAEAKEILALAKKVPQDGYDGGRDLRIHVTGDCRTEQEARILAKAAQVYQEAGGGKVWAYTHSWAVIPRKAWGSISVLASVENLETAAKAKEQGYVPAMVVSEFPGRTKFNVGNKSFIPCPNQTTPNVSCASCRLCLDDSLLSSRNVGIAFAAHGVRKEKLKRRLNVL